MDMYSRFAKKYGSEGDVILPPSFDVEKTTVPIETISKPNSTREIPDKWMDLLRESEGMDPLTEKPAEDEDTILQSLQNEEEAPPYEKELLKALRPEFHSADKDAKTVRPPKKASVSADDLIVLCSSFYDLATF
jgi:transposase-like protein